MEGTGLPSQSPGVTNNGGRDQLIAVRGNVNKTTVHRDNFAGATFYGNVYFGTEEQFDPFQECLRSLIFPDMDSRFLDIDTATQGTCEWLSRHEMYTKWTSDDRGLLWIKGKPGSGKSTLLRHVQDSMMETSEADTLVLSFFFHGRGNDLQKTPLGLFRSLLHQLGDIDGALSAIVETFAKKSKTVGKPGEKWDWHPRELQRHFETSLLKVLKTHSVWLFVDALDECGKENALDLAEWFESFLQRLPSSDINQIHICFTCRHYPILALDHTFQVCVEEENRRDISVFVENRLSSPHQRISPTIPKLITERANGIFLWAQLVVNRVQDLNLQGIGLKKIETAVNSVPERLDKLYHELLQRMTPDSLKLIQWICFATRPLSLEEFRWAMIVEHDCLHQSLDDCESAADYPPEHDKMQRQVHTLSCGLAEAVSSPNISSTPMGSSFIQFIHQSVKDFFIEKGLSDLHQKSTSADMAIGLAHFRLSRICIRYLAMKEFKDFNLLGNSKNELTTKFPLLHYATTSWAVHTKQSDTKSISQKDLLDFFSGSSETFMARWVHIYKLLDRFRDYPPEGTTLVHVMSRYGVVGVLRVLLEGLQKVDGNLGVKDSEGRTPLSWAAQGGHEATVRLLLDPGTATESRDKLGQTPLSAARRGYKAIVRLLLDRGAAIDSRDKLGQTPLLWAAKEGHEAIVRLLLDRGAATDSRDESGRTPLSWAAERGHEAIVRLLLDRGAATNSRDEFCQTPLSWAAERGHEAIVRLLLNRGAAINSRDKLGQTPLLWAAKEGHEAIVRLLLSRGAATDSRDESGQTPLSWAAEKGHEAIVRLLLSRGAAIDSRDNWGRTPLSWAAERGHEAIVRLLLSRGAAIDSRDNKGRTPLSWAAERGHKAIVRLLLDRGAATNSRDEFCQTPLSWAAERGHEAIVRLLLSRGAAIDSRDNKGRTPLSWAAERGHEATVRLLLDWGADGQAVPPTPPTTYV